LRCGRIKEKRFLNCEKCRIKMNIVNRRWKRQQRLRRKTMKK
jgi:hypothetical protein